MTDSSTDWTLWRYMSVGSFLSLIQTRTLLFSSLLRLSLNDRFEVPYHIDFSSPEMTASLENPKTAQQTLNRLTLSSRAFVNCWHRSSDESYAMWSIYTQDEGIAVRTTESQLRRALPENVTIGHVQYSTDCPTELTKRLLWKRRCYSYEEEVRAQIILDRTTGLDIHFVPVCLTTLIDSIYVSPSASWLEEIVRRELELWQLPVPVHASDV